MTLLWATNRATKPLRALKPPKECNAFGGFSFAQGGGPLRTLMRDAQWPQGISVLKCSQPIATSVGGTLCYVHSDHPFGFAQGRPGLHRGHQRCRRASRGPRAIRPQWGSHHHPCLYLSPNLCYNIREQANHKPGDGARVSPYPEQGRGELRMSTPSRHVQQVAELVRRLNQDEIRELVRVVPAG
jgi:hypothetical protein